MSSPEKPALKKYMTTLRNGKPFIEYTPEYKAQLRHKTRWQDRIASGLVGLAGAAAIGTLAAVASYVAPLVPIAAQACMAALSTIAASTGVLAAAGVAALGGGASLAVVGVVGLLSAAGAFRLYDEYKIAMENDFRPVSALSVGGVTLAVALGMAMTAAPELPQNAPQQTAPQQFAVSKRASVSAAFDSARCTQLNTVKPVVQTRLAVKNAPQCRLL